MMPMPLPRVFKALLRFSLSLPVAGLLVAAGCSKDGGQPQPSCSKWAPGTAAGPGDVGLHFPFSAENRWVTNVPGTTSGAWQSHEVSGTRTVLGQTATVLASFDLDTRSPLGESYSTVNDHGVIELGNNDSSDTLTPALVPYYSARFPLSVGDAFTSLQCSNLDYGEDLDGDGKNEFLDVQLTVAVAAVEPVVTDLATYPDAVRVEQRLALTLRASGSSQRVTQEGRVKDWLAPGVGQVREVTEAPEGSLQAARDLVGYAIGAVRKGLLARRLVESGIDGPYGPFAWTFDGTSHVVAGRHSGLVGVPGRVTAVRMMPGGLLSAPFDLLTVASGVEISPPALAAGGGVVAALVSTWLGAEVLLQRMNSAGTLLEPAGGKVIGEAVSYWSSGCRPALASDGAGFLGVWPAAAGGLIAARIGADGTKLAGEAAIDGNCAVTAFDGSRYLVVYQQRVDQLLAVHITTDGAVVETAPLVLSSTPGTKHPIAMVFDGAQHILLLADSRDGVSMALTLRRLSPNGEWLDGDAATGGLVLLPRWASMNQASVYGESVTLDGATPMVAWASGVQYLAGEEAWVMRLGPDGNPIDLHGALPGVDTYLGDPAACGGVTFPIALGGADGMPEVLYNVDCGYPTYTETLRAVRFGL
jgi:hypothetical protein